MKDGKRLVITIGRQFGSGGCEVGTKLDWIFMTRTFCA